jgi:phospholipid/cholesterol/gamma-HCH transport system substrate-binding protein
MAGRNLSELLAGAAVLVVAVGFLGYAVASTGRTSSSGYTLHASFERIDGLGPGSDVRIAGVKVGRINTAVIDPKTYQAQIAFTVQQDIQLPTDSSAEVTSDGLLGGKVLQLVPGGSDKMLANGGRITITQSAASLEDLLGKFIFNVGDLSSNVKASLKENQPAAATSPGPAPNAPSLLPPLK